MRITVSLIPQVPVRWLGTQMRGNKLSMRVDVALYISDQTILAGTVSHQPVPWEASYSICSSSSATVGSVTTPSTSPAGPPLPAPIGTPRSPSTPSNHVLTTSPPCIPTISSVCVSSHTPILLSYRAILDAGSQRSCVTTRVQEALEVALRIYDH